MTPHTLSTYHQKRNFSLTAEPKGRTGRKSGKNLKFVIQLHAARRTHYDFRLEWNGVMKSWAVTRGPSFDPADKRLAVRTEDHPMEYNEFEGVIPDKQYGAGPVMIWDEGVWRPEGDPEKMEKKGHINFTIEGGRMKGAWHLVRMRTQEKRENWLLIKSSDEYALSKAKSEKFMKGENTSIISGRTIEEIKAAGAGKTVKRKTKPKSGSSLPALMKEYGGPELATLVENAPGTDDWPDKQERHERLLKGVDIMKSLWQGKVLTNDKGPIKTHKARIWSLPEVSPKIYAAALTPETAGWAGEWADGLITVHQRKEDLHHMITAFHKAGGEGKPLILQMHVSWAETDEQAQLNAWDQWRSACLDEKDCADLRTPEDFDRACAAVEANDMDKEILISADIEKHIEWVKEFQNMGFDEIYIHNAGRNQMAFLEAYEREFFPKIDM